MSEYDMAEDWDYMWDNREIDSAGDTWIDCSRPHIKRDYYRLAHVTNKAIDCWRWVMNKRIRKKRMKLEHQWSKTILRRLRNSPAGKAFKFNMINPPCYCDIGFDFIEDLNAPVYEE